MPWLTYQLLMGSLWVPYGFPMDSLWIPYGFPICLPGSHQCNLTRHSSSMLLFLSRCMSNVQVKTTHGLSMGMPSSRIALRESYTKISAENLENLENLNLEGFKCFNNIKPVTSNHDSWPKNGYGLRMPKRYCGTRGLWGSFCSFWCRRNDAKRCRSEVVVSLKKLFKNWCSWSLCRCGSLITWEGVILLLQLPLFPRKIH